ncbi:hypothetical protein [Neobittarella massiliensis]|nr:hypothetical protein [Neobittarella massiliensis]
MRHWGASTAAEDFAYQSDCLLAGTQREDFGCWVAVRQQDG